MHLTNTYYVPGTVLALGRQDEQMRNTPSSNRDYILIRETENEHASHEAGDINAILTKSRVRRSSLREQIGHSGPASLRG